jgi:hypothetical protein
MRTICKWKLFGFSVFAVAFAWLVFVWFTKIPSARVDERKGATVGQLPLSFEVNRGQAAADAKFVARGGGYAMLLTGRGEPVLALHGQPHQTAGSHVESPQQASSSELREPSEQTLLRLEFPGGNPTPHVQGEQPMAARSNYLVGNDPAKWITGVPHYARVQYREIYPGVDVLYYAKDQKLEYDFIVRPGTDPDSIRMTVRGVQEIEPSESGSLVLQTAAGSVVLHKPVAYQQGPSGEQEVACNYVLDKGEVRFALGDYDRSQVLRIDPVLSYSARLDAYLKAIAVDESGNSYLVGVTFSINFPTTAGAFQSVPGGNADAVIAKLDPTGSTLLFATYLGGDQFDSADGIVLDSSGNVIVAGSTNSKNFPVSLGFQSTLLGEGDAFISKLDSSGAQLLYSSYLGGSGSERASGIALEDSGRVLVTGTTSSSNFPTTPSAFQAAYGGGNTDAFVTKLDTTQSGVASLLFSTYLGGSSEDVPSAAAVDASGNAFVAGSTRSTNFPTANAFQSACASCTRTSSQFGDFVTFDAFISKLNASGTALIYSTFVGGNHRDVGEAIALDNLGNAYVAGETWSSDFPTTAGAFQTSLRPIGDAFAFGPADAFVTKLNTAGSILLYSSFIGGGDLDGATGISLDASGNAFLSGYSYSTDFPTVNALQGRSGGVDCADGWGNFRCSDAIVAQINPNGSALLFSTYLGGAGFDDSGAGIAVDSTGNAYVAGTAGDAFPFTSGAVHMYGGGFAARISPGNAPAFSFDPQQVDFGPQPVGSTSAAVAVLVRNLGNATLTISSISISGDFTQTNNCGSGVVGGSYCTVQLTFAPTTLGSHNGTLVVNDNALGSPHSIPLNGTGTEPTISLTVAQTSATVAKGGTATFPLTVGQVGALTSAIAFSCSGLPVGWSCGFNPTTVPAGSGPTQVTLTVQSGSSTAQNLPRAPIGVPGMLWETWLGVLLLLTLAVLLGGRVRKAAYLRPGFALGFATLLLLLAGCGSTSSQPPQSPQPQPFTVNFTVNATSGTTTTSMPLSITVR